MAVDQSVVVDANIIAALALPLAYSESSHQLLVTWKQRQVRILAPILLQYEVSTVLRKAVVGGLIGEQVAREALGHVLNLGIDYWSPTRRLHERALYWAQQLGQTKTYDAHYLALAEDADTDFWTADQRLLNNVIQHGGIRIHLIGEAP